MPKVLHIGPCDTPGGMANVMRILAEHPPEGWQAELLSSHVVGSPWAKWRAYRKARKSLIQILSDDARRPDIVHLHTAADWSWWRKRRFAQLAHKAGVPNIVHIHSGQFDSWLQDSTNRAARFRNSVRSFDSSIVVLSESWKLRLQNLIGKCDVIHNPLHPAVPSIPEAVRDSSKVLFLARNDPVKGGDFARELVRELRNDLPSITLFMSGIHNDDSTSVRSLGWMTEAEKYAHLSTAGALIVPSKFEGQPMVVLEALAMGTPVLLSDRIHSLPDKIPRARFEDIEDWKKHLHDLLSNDLASNNSALLGAFSMELINQKWSHCYSKLLN